MARKPNCLYPIMLILAFCFHTAFCLHTVASDDGQCVCSKFSYEISTLEKMIRTEVKVEGMLDEFKKYAEQIKETEERNRVVLEELKTKSENMDKALEEKEAKIEKMTQDLIEFRNETANELRDIAVSPLVAFRANTIADKSPVADQTLVFTTPVLNEGQRYDNVTGQFTAPIDGLYHLSVQLCHSIKSIVYYDFVVDDEIINSGTFYDYYGRICDSTDTTVILRRGMKAWIKCATGSSSSSDILYEGRNHMNIFSGFLVRKIEV